MLSLILGIALIGFVVWLILLIPMPDQFRKVIIAVACVLAVLWALQTLGIHTGFQRIQLK